MLRSVRKVSEAVQIIGIIKNSKLYIVKDIAKNVFVYEVYRSFYQNKFKLYNKKKNMSLIAVKESDHKRFLKIVISHTETLLLLETVTPICCLDDFMESRDS